MPTDSSPSIKPPIKIAAAGSTHQTVKCLQTLDKSPQFEISWVLTPAPKKIGRDQKLSKNPAHSWVEKTNKQQSQQNKQHPSLPLITISKKINQDIKQEIEYLTAQDKLNSPAWPDLLLVVDFGYLIPDWLLELPKKAPVNLHPSKLPRWRGGSPGQMIILSGQQKSAITLMRITKQLDAGPIIKQQEFKLKTNWTSADFYDYSFAIAAKNLEKWLVDYVEGRLKEEPQPAISPTGLAREIQKQDAYVPWNLIKQLMPDPKVDNSSLKSSSSQKTAADLEKFDFPKRSILKKFLRKNETAQWAVVIEHASRAFKPWPILWTKVPTKQGEKRMQIISCKIGLNQQLILKRVKIAGQVEADWNQVKNGIIDS